MEEWWAEALAVGVMGLVSQGTLLLASCCQKRRGQESNRAGSVKKQIDAHESPPGTNAEPTDQKKGEKTPTPAEGASGGKGKSGMAGAKEDSSWESVTASEEAEPNGAKKRRTKTQIAIAASRKKTKKRRKKKGTEKDAKDGKDEEKKGEGKEEKKEEGKAKKEMNKGVSYRFDGVATDLRESKMVKMSPTPVATEKTPKESSKSAKEGKEGKEGKEEKEGKEGKEEVKPQEGNYMELGILDRLADDLKQDLKIDANDAKSKDMKTTATDVPAPPATPATP